MTGSSVVAGPPNGSCSIHGRHSFAAEAGHHLAPQRLSSGRNVFEELGSCFTLLAFDVAEPAIRAFTDAAKSLQVPLKVICDTYAVQRKDYAARMVLVRPDQYVVWAADDAPADPGALMRRVSGRR